MMFLASSQPAMFDYQLARLDWIPKEHHQILSVKLLCISNHHCCVGSSIIQPTTKPPSFHPLNITCVVKHGQTNMYVGSHTHQPNRRNNKSSQENICHHLSSSIHMGSFQKWGYPNSWRVYKGKSPSKMDDLGVYFHLWNSLCSSRW